MKLITCAACGLEKPHKGRGICAACHARQRRESGIVKTHNYAGYTSGCRCDDCRAAKAAYHRDRRASAMALAQPGQVVDGAMHGTRHAYKEKGCRCDACVAYMRELWRRWDRNRRTAEMSAQA